MKFSRGAEGDTLVRAASKVLVASGSCPEAASACPSPSHAEAGPEDLRTSVACMLAVQVNVGRDDHVDRLPADVIGAVGPARAEHDPAARGLHLSAKRSLAVGAGDAEPGLPQQHADFR